MNRRKREALRVTKLKLQEKDRELLWLTVAIVLALILLVFSLAALLASVGVRWGSLNHGSLFGVSLPVLISVPLMVLGIAVLVLRVVGVVPELSELVFRGDVEARAPTRKKEKSA